MFEKERVKDMLTLVFICLMFKMTWGIAKVLFTLVFLPFVLIALTIGGLVTIALPLVVVVGIISLVCGAVRR